MNLVQRHLESIDMYFQRVGLPENDNINTTESLILHFLVENSLYDKIYYYFGSDTYKRYTPVTIQVRDIYILMIEQKYYHLYEKYGNKVYSILLPYIKRQDIKNELGKAPILIVSPKFKQNLISAIITIAVTGLLGNIALSSLIVYSLSRLSTDLEDQGYDLVELDKYLEDYDKSVKAYADYIKGLGLSDLETIVKVIDDMWNNIDGYSLNVDGYVNNPAYFRLALYKLGRGNCKHMSDDFTARMNAINPKYNAYNLYVYMEEISVNNTDRDILDNDPENTSSTSAADRGILGEVLQDYLKHRIGNHAVSCITIPDTEIKLAVDPTNPSIGIILNGEIVTLTDSRVKNMKICSDTTLGFRISNADELVEYLKDYFRSYFSAPNYDDMNDSYGKEAQNEALEILQKTYPEDKYIIDKETTTDSSPSSDNLPKKMILEQKEKN